MTDTVMQLGFAGLADDQVAGDIVDRCRAMLRDEPLTRADYDYAWLRYLERYHRLPAEVRAAVMCIVMDGAPSYRTVANRIQELIAANADLRPPPEVMERRQRQRRQGRVR